MDNTEKLAKDEEKQNKKHNTICGGHHNMQTKSNNENKTWILPQTTEGKDELNIDLIEIEIVVITRKDRHTITTHSFHVFHYPFLTDLAKTRLVFFLLCDIRLELAVTAYSYFSIVKCHMQPLT